MNFNYANCASIMWWYTANALCARCSRVSYVLFHFLSVLTYTSNANHLMMYNFCTSSFLSGKTSHKDVKHTANGLLKLYYGYRPFMAFCCVASEVYGCSHLKQLAWWTRIKEIQHGYCLGWYLVGELSARWRAARIRMGFKILIQDMFMWPTPTKWTGPCVSVVMHMKLISNIIWPSQHTQHSFAHLAN
jgi:hypothetical protein